MQEQQSQSFQGQNNTDFFNQLGGGILLSKKQKLIQKQILDNSSHIQQKTLQQKIKKFKNKNTPVFTPIQQNNKQLLANKKNTMLPHNLSTKNNITFQQLKIIKPILKAVSQLDYTYPTPIQTLAIPAILSGKDVFASSITGSGKTAAFLIPILQRYYNCDSVNYSRVLIITPTRQLAIQIYQNFNSLNKYIRIQACLTIGASSIQKQQSQLRNYPQIIIGTPGRILDLLTNSQGFGLQYLQVLVFDEADKLLEMGFQAQIKQILTHLNDSFQTILFSATLGKQVNKLVNMAMRKPIRISADPDNATAEKLHQQIYKLPKDDQSLRQAALITMLSRIYTKKVIVFFKTKKQCHRIAIIMGLLGLPACQLHGNLSQTQRIQAFNQFKQGKFQYLMATDLAARGLDIKLVQTVINYELPTELTRYIHRVGRTARAGNIGTCITICLDSQSLKLKKMMKSTGDKVFKLSLQEQILKQTKKMIQNLQGDFNNVIELQRQQRSIRLAQMQLKKLQNITEHKQEIYNKPRKTWFLTAKQKSKIKQDSKKDALGQDYVEKIVKTKQIFKGKQKGGKNDKRNKNKKKLRKY